MIDPSVSRNPGLDVLRSLCLFLVVAQHSFLFTDAFFPKFRMLWIISHSALDVFFTLSGFLIGGVIWRKFRQDGTLTMKSIFNFYKRRWFKTVPMYFLTVGLCVLLSHAGIYYAQDFSWKFLVFLQNLTRADFDFLPHTYSLTIEEWFYILFPPGVFLVLKSGLFRGNPFYPVIVVWIFAGAALRLAVHFNGVENWDVEIRKPILTRVDATIYGVMLYFIHLKIPEAIKRHRLLLFCLGGIFYLVCTLAMHYKLSLLFNNVVYYTVVPVCISMLLPLFLYLRLPGFFERLFTFQSLASYSVYLVHLPLLYIAYHYCKPESPAGSLALMASFVVLSYGLGSVLYRFIEKPVMDLRDG